MLDNNVKFESRNKGKHQGQKQEQWLPGVKAVLQRRTREI